MASADRAELPDIFEANAAKLSLKHHFRVKRDFDDLSEVIDLLPSPAVETFHPSYAPFLQLLLTAKSPRWEDVEASLESTFGSERGEKMVIPGEWGIGAVREVIGRAIFEVEVAELPKARYWIAWLESSVQYTRDRLLTPQPGTTSPPIDNGASSTSQASVSNDRKNPSVSANPQPVHLDKSTPVTQDSHHRSTSSPLSDVDQTRAQSSVDPDFETTEQPSTLAGRRNTSKRPRGKAVSPSSSSEEKFERSPPPKKLNKGKGKAMEADEATEEEGDEDADPVRTKKISSASKRMKRMIIDEDTEDEVEIVPVPSGSGSNPTQGGVNTADIAPHPQSAEERLVRSIFPSIPANINLTPSPTLVPAGADLDRGFARPRDGSPDMGGLRIAMVSLGYTENDPIYRRDANHLCMTIDMNICSTPSEKAHRRNKIFEAGQPVVVIGREEKCQLIIDAIVAKHRMGKTTSFINVWVNNDSVKVKGKNRSRWFYKGMYEVAYDGSKKGKGEYLPVPSEGGTREVHDELLKKVLVHVKGTHSDAVLPSWEFSSRDAEGAEAEIQTENTGGRRRHVKFIALRCIGWDHKSWKIWTANREAREEREG